MKKLLASLLSLTLAFFIVGCSSSGVSQSEYDALLAENNQLKTDLDAVKTERDTLKTELDALKSSSKEDAPVPSQNSNNDESTNKDGSRKNPMKLGEVFQGVYTERDYKYDISISLLEVISGDAAWELIHEANQFNDPPGEGMQYIMAKFSVTYLEDITGEDQPLEFNQYAFNYSTSEYQVKDIPSIVCPDPEFDVVLYEGASGEGWVVFLAEADDPAPKAIFIDSLWFDLF